MNTEKEPCYCDERHCDGFRTTVAPTETPAPARGSWAPNAEVMREMSPAELLEAALHYAKRDSDARHRLVLARGDQARLRAELEQLDMLSKVETGVRVRAQADVERLTRERDAEKQLRLNTEAVLDFANGKLVKTIARAETAERAASVAQREVCERRARDHSPRFGGNAAADKRAIAIAKAEGWDCYPGS